MNAKQNVPAAGQPNTRAMLVWGSILVVAALAFVWNLYVIMRDTSRDAGYRELVGNLLHGFISFGVQLERLSD